MSESGEDDEIEIHKTDDSLSNVLTSEQSKKQKADAKARKNFINKLQIFYSLTKIQQEHVRAKKDFFKIRREEIKTLTAEEKNKLIVANKKKLASGSAEKQTLSSSNNVVFPTSITSDTPIVLALAINIVVSLFISVIDVITIVTVE